MSSTVQTENTDADYVQVSSDRKTVWAHTDDASTVGRFSKTFGMDVHTTITAQLNGASQCLSCTHGPAGEQQWAEFCELMQRHYGIMVARNLLSFGDVDRQ